MNEIIHKCRFLEDNLSINTADDYVFSNIGFLISTDLSLITELCKYDFNRDKIYATKMKDIMISKKTTSTRSSAARKPSLTRSKASRKWCARG